MTLNNPKSGIGYATEFQSSALPWATSATAPPAGSPVRFNFAKVSRFITITNRDPGANTLSFGFTRSGVVSTNNKFIVNAGQSLTVELRIKELWLQGETGTPPYSICAGLTNIDASQMPVLSGTLPNGDPGWDGVG